MLPRFYIEDIDFKINQEVRVAKPIMQHMRALRLKIHDNIEIFDGKSLCFKAQIFKIDRNEIIIKILAFEILSRIQKPLVKLAIAIVANDKMDYILQKATELEVDEIIPIVSQRVQNNFKFLKDKKHLHWQKIIANSCEQCGRNFFPVLHEICDFKDLYNKNLISLSDNNFILSPFISDLNHKNRQLNLDINKNSLILVGPEGGFTDEELNLVLQKYNFKSVTLGDLTLRTETAAIAAITCINIHYNSWITVTY